MDETPTAIAESTTRVLGQAIARLHGHLDGLVTVIHA